MDKRNNKNLGTHYWSRVISLTFFLSGWLVIPIVIGLIVGQWLDRQYATTPWLFLVSIIIAFIVTSLGIVKEMFSYLKELEDELGDEK